MNKKLTLNEKFNLIFDKYVGALENNSHEISDILEILKDSSISSADKTELSKALKELESLDKKITKHK